jgi:hypothetical protein
MRVVPLIRLQSYLDYYCWRLYRQDSRYLFLAMLEDFQIVFDISQSHTFR